jgi:predicted nucleic acid-binding Zn ribbon protein
VLLQIGVVRMAVYVYEHQKEACALGRAFEIEHSIKDPALTTCPSCGGEIKRLISRVYISTPTTNAELKNMGFKKLVRRDQGVYENVTATSTSRATWKRASPRRCPI